MEVVREKQEPTLPETTAAGELFVALRRLDLLLERAIVAAHEAYGAASLSDRFRGLHISPEEVERLLARDPGEPVFQISPPAMELPSIEESRLTWLADRYGLSPFDLDLLLIALAPELDLRYERLYAYLQDDVTRRRPSVDLALNLLCSTAPMKIERRRHLAPQASLVRHRLIHLLTDANQLAPPLLAQYLKVDDQMVRWLLGEQSLDGRLILFSDLVRPEISLDALPLNAELKQTFLALSNRAVDSWPPVRLYLQGAESASQHHPIAEAFAMALEKPLLAADLSQAINTTAADFRDNLRLLFREALLQNAVLLLEGMDALQGEERVGQRQSLLDALAQSVVTTVMSGQQPWGAFTSDRASIQKQPIGVLPITIPFPDVEQRRSYWQSCLRAAKIRLDKEKISALSSRFRLTPDRIAEAVATARNRYNLIEEPMQSVLSALSAEQSKVEWFTALLAAARQQSSHDLASLALKIEPHYRWNDIVLPDDTSTQLREICSRVAHSHQVLDNWGFGSKLSHGKGISALFAGPSGTGKTMAADIIAHELGLDLYKIDLAGVVSKYIGETEKNLDRIFTAAENANAILFFDEADALFGKRSEVRDSHDRYANIEISYLLQKMEQYEGITILATNLRQNMDDAFVRRLAFTVHFPFPDETQRKQIWNRVWPSALPLAPDVDVEFLANQFKLSGGNIKNIALASAFLAAADGEAVTMKHLRHATQQEYQKLGKMLSTAELYGRSNGT